jgi:hypothetical protein
MAWARMLGLAAVALVALAAFALLASGCRRSTALYPVAGKITYRGAALNNGVIVFTPDASRGESGPSALGTIRADGTYTLSTGDAAGANSGWYRITVAAVAAPAPKTPVPAQFQAPLPLLPEKYRDPELSLLRCQIKPDQPNTIDLTLD